MVTLEGGRRWVPSQEARGRVGPPATRLIPCQSARDAEACVGEREREREEAPYGRGGITPPLTLIEDTTPLQCT